VTVPVLDQELLAEVGAALRRAGNRAALSHELAAVAWGVELVDAPVRRVTVPRNRSRLALPGWLVVRSDLAAGDVEVAGGPTDGVRLTSLPRTLSDICRVLPLGPAVAAVDSALRRGLVPLEDLALHRTAGRGCDRARRVAALLDPLSGSVLESLLRVLLVQAGLPAPVSQHVVLDRQGRVVGRVDLCWPAERLVVEADGFAFHSDRAAYRNDRRRLNELELLGWRVLRFSWEDVVGRPAAVVAAVRECLRQAA
jgi:hypothetical protein